MVDIETEVFDACADALYASHDGVIVTSAPLTAPASLPAVCVCETSSSTDASRLDSSGSERGRALTYEARAYSNRTIGARAECKSLLATVDSVLVPLNFRRSSTAWQDARSVGVTQLVATYMASVDENEKIYRR